MSRRLARPANSLRFIMSNSIPVSSTAWSRQTRLPDWLPIPIVICTGTVVPRGVSAGITAFTCSIPATWPGAACVPDIRDASADSHTDRKQRSWVRLLHDTAAIEDLPVHLTCPGRIDRNDASRFRSVQLRIDRAVLVDDRALAAGVEHEDARRGIGYRVRQPCSSAALRSRVERASWSGRTLQTERWQRPDLERHK